MNEDSVTQERDEEKLIAIIQKNTEGGKEVSLSANLRDDLGLDSFGTIMIIDAIEEEFNITVDEADLEKFVTVADIWSTLKHKYLTSKT